MLLLVPSTAIVAAAATAVAAITAKGVLPTRMLVLGLPLLVLLLPQRVLLVALPWPIIAAVSLVVAGTTTATKIAAPLFAAADASAAVALRRVPPGLRR
eukprot:752875-Alexandrium_andersonii.AAC.1